MFCSVIICNNSPAVGLILHKGTIMQKVCRFCGVLITEQNQAIKNMSWGISIRNECKPCRSKLNVIYKQKKLVDKQVPCENCGEPCIKQYKRAACSPKCRMLLSIYKTDTCWLWIGRKNKEGYGRAVLNKVETMSHRIVYELFKEPIEKGKILLHSCHNPGCVNPDHLRQGTDKENSLDMIAARRSSHGEKHHSSKLTDEQIREIKMLHLDGLTQTAIAKIYNVSQPCVGCVLRKKTWKDVNILFKE